MARVIRQNELRSLVKSAYHAAALRRETSSIISSGHPAQHLQRQGFASSQDRGTTKVSSQDIWHPVRFSRCLEHVLSPRSHQWFQRRARGMFFSNVPEDEAVVTEITETVSVSPEAESKVVSLETEIERGSQVLNIENDDQIAFGGKAGETLTEETSSTISGDNVLPGSSSPPPNVMPMPKVDPGREIQPGRVYVAGLPLRQRGEELKKILRDLCSKHGNVVDVTLGQHRHMSSKAIEAGRHRGFAFVTMESAEQARAVIEKLHSATAFDGRTIRASYGLKQKLASERPKIDKKNYPFRRVVYVGNLHESTTGDALALHFQQLGAIEQVKVLTELHTERSRGFGFITFEKEDQALQAVRDKNGSSLDGSSIVVNIAKYPRGY